MSRESLRTHPPGEYVLMRITRVADWILFSTSRFDEQVAYLRDVLGMPVEK